MSEIKRDENGDPIFVKLKYKHKTLKELVNNFRANAEIVNNATLIMRGRRFNNLVEEMICDLKEETETIRAGLATLKSSMGEAKSNFELCEKRMIDMDDLMERMLHLIQLKQEEQAAAISSSEQGIVCDVPAKSSSVAISSKVALSKGPTATNHLTGAISKASMKENVTKKSKKKESTTVRKVSLLTEEEFSRIPDYITKPQKLTVESVNDFICKFNQAIDGKYKLLRRPLKELTRREVDRRNKLKFEEVTVDKDAVFITEDDILYITKVNLSKSDLTIISALRQAQRVKEHRTRGLLCYMVM